jgi:mannose-1-phosphate guanylyltransferase
MRAVILVGGFGTRLRPLTNSVPKPMLPVGHEPMIARLIDRLGCGGVTEVVLALGFRPEPFIEAFPDGRCGDVALTYAVEPETLDTAGAIRFAAEAAGIDDTFVVANGDIVTDLDVGSLVSAHKRFAAEATIHLIGVDDPSSFGVVEIDDGGAVSSFVEKPAPGDEPSNLINAGTYVFEPSVLARIPSGPVSLERQTFPLIANDGGMYGYSTDDYWIDAGRPDSYRAVKLDLLNGVRPGESCEAISASANVHADATIRNSVVGDRVTVGAGAVVVNSVLLPDAQIGGGASIAESLVMGVVAEHATVNDEIVG